jgi:CheY-like chemotaxis protein
MNFQKFGNLKVLLVNDELVTINVLYSILVNTLMVPCSQVVKAFNGQEGFEAATAGDFDLIIMDLNMPVMGGVLATTKIRAFFDYNLNPLSESTTLHKKQPWIVALTGDTITKAIRD